MAVAQKTQVVHYPTLKTVLAIEGVIKNADLAVSRNEILKRLPKKVMRSTLNYALNYLEARGMFWRQKRDSFGHTIQVKSFWRRRTDGWRFNH